jgi:hypothetical protein
MFHHVHLCFFFQGSYNYIGPINNVIPILTGPNENIFINNTYPPLSYQYNYISEGATEVAFNSQIYVDIWFRNRPGKSHFKLFW